MKFDTRLFACETMCEPERRVFNPETLECDYCNDKCTKCSGDINTCLECKPDYTLNFDLTCQDTCSAVNQTSIEGVCFECEQPCATCELAADRCTTCTGDYFLYYTECVQYCPDKYEADLELR